MWIFYIIRTIRTKNFTTNQKLPKNGLKFGQKWQFSIPKSQLISNPGIGIWNESQDPGIGFRDCKPYLRIILVTIWTFWNNVTHYLEFLASHDKTTKFTNKIKNLYQNSGRIAKVQTIQFSFSNGEKTQKILLRNNVVVFTTAETMAYINNCFLLQNGEFYFNAQD